MHTTLVLLLSLSIGCILGYVYGLSLRYQQGKVPPLFFGLVSLLRILITVGLFFYLLHSNAIHFILLLISFTGTFWLTMLWFLR